MKIIAHRGSTKTFPENTLGAFRQAFLEGADGIELDVQLCKSGVPVVIHDELLNRTTNAVGPVRDRLLSDIILLDAGQGQTIPTLRQVLEMLPHDKIAFIEIKQREAAITVAEIVMEYITINPSLAERLIMISFDSVALRAVKTVSDNLLVGFTYKDKQSISELSKCGYNSIQPELSLVTETLVREAHLAGLKVYPFTAKEKKDHVRAKKAGADGLITDV